VRTTGGVQDQQGPGSSVSGPHLLADPQQLLVLDRCTPVQQLNTVVWSVQSWAMNALERMTGLWPHGAAPAHATASMVGAPGGGSRVLAGRGLSLFAERRAAVLLSSPCGPGYL
jgi:hypothetical protein